MALQAGTHLGPYEIQASIGAGGMGEVYRARDTRLDRTVAVKVLPEHVAKLPEQRQRFEREARAVSSLNHPHICVLHDIGRQGDIDFLVMEYLEGESLAARLQQGPLPLDQLLRYAVQIADALGQAHRQGVFHRDLKPGNIMLTRAGAKLLDFGLAKLKAPEARSVVVGTSAAATVDAGLTQKGTILGTFQYMAPEQVQGKDSDGRADIFSFGAVLYEMATGRKAFAGDNHATLIASILSAQPPPIEDPRLERVVKKCLAKDPDDRWQNALDLASELKWIAEGGSGVGGHGTVVGAAAAPVARRTSWLWPAVAAVILAAALPFVISYFRRTAPPEPLVRFTIPPPEKASFASTPAISPDGSRIAFTIQSGGKTQLWVRPLHSLNAQTLPGTEGAMFPFWSPDNRSIGFFAQGKLKKIDLAGGFPQTLADASSARGGTWSPDGTIVFAPRVTSVLERMSAAGGESSAVTTLDASLGHNTHRWPYFLPDGRHFLYFARSSQPDQHALYVGSLGSKESKLLLKVNSNATYAPAREGRGGYLLFVRESTLLARPFDPDKLEFTGEPFALAEQVNGPTPVSGAAFSNSDTGLLAYGGGGGGTNTQLVWFDRSGKQVGTLGEITIYHRPELSPDGQRLVVNILNPQTGVFDLWLLELSRPVQSRFTFSSNMSWWPVWSPDGQRIVYSTNPKGRFGLYQKVASGGSDEEPLLQSENHQFATDWSKDGKFLVYEQMDDKNRYDLWVLPISGDRKPAPFLRTPFQEWQGQFSPDGRFIAYVSDESGRQEVYVRPYPPSSAKWQISTGGGAQPRWRGDGKELFYLSADRKMMAAPVKIGAGLEASATEVLFDVASRINVVLSREGIHYDITPNGQRFLMICIVEQTSSTPITVVMNWAAERKR